MTAALRETPRPTSRQTPRETPSAASAVDGYSARHLTVLEGLEAVRKRPGMYIGSTDERGLQHCLWEIIDNAVDEALNASCTKIEIILHPDQSAEVRDNGRGIPVDVHPKTGLSALEQAWWRLRGRRRLRLVDHMMRKEGKTDASAIFRSGRFLAREGFGRARLHFYNHHLAHALPAYFYSGFDEALVHTADGTGDGVAYSARIGRRGGLELLFGGDENFLGRRERDSLGMLYGGFTAALGFKANRHEGKLVGLAAYGRPVAAEIITSWFRVEETGRIRAQRLFRKNREIGEAAAGVCRDLSPGDAAASIQEAVEVLKAVLANGPVLAKDVKNEAHRAGVSERTLARAKALLCIRARLVGFGKDGKWYWSLPCSGDANSARERQT